MLGNSLAEFIDDLLSMGGSEKEFLFRGRKYFLQCQFYENDNSLIEMVIYECFGNEKYIFRCQDKNYSECVEQFENVPIFDNMTIYKAEPEIEVLFG